MSAIGVQHAERADAVGAVAVLEAPEDLALDHQHDRHELQADGEDHERLEDLDPPRLGVADDRRAASAGSGSCAAHLDERAVQAVGAVLRDRRLQEDGALERAARGCARSPLTLCPSEPTTTRSPWAMPRRCGVGGRELDALARVQELQRRRGLDLGRGPDRAERAEAQAAVGAARRRAAPRARTAPRGGGRVRRRPARARASARRVPPISSSVRPA